MKKYGLPILILITCIIYIFIQPGQTEIVRILFKLIPMWLILIYAYLQIPDIRSRPHQIIWIGLFFCMLGDGLLRWFVIGLTAFLICHLFYLSGFFQYWRFSKLRLLTILPVGIFSLTIGYSIISAIIQNNQDSLIIPVLFYILVISLMAWSALMTNNRWAIVGSLLFVLSDSILSWNMFVSNVSQAHILIMTTYYAAQFLIAHSLRTFPVKSAPYRRNTFPTEVIK